MLASRGGIPTTQARSDLRSDTWPSTDAAASGSLSDYFMRPSYGTPGDRARALFSLRDASSRRPAGVRMNFSWRFHPVAPAERA